MYKQNLALLTKCTCDSFMLGGFDPLLKEDIDRDLFGLGLISPIFIQIYMKSGFKTRLPLIHTVRMII